MDDFAGPDDPAFTGWHRLEYLLFEKNTTRGAAKLADGLDKDLASLKSGVAALEIPPAAVALGASELIQEVSEGKITGEEDRYSKTDLWDFNANVEGSQKVIEFLTPALQSADPDLLAAIQAGFGDLRSGLAPLRKGEGWVLFCPQDDEFPSPLCPKPTVTPVQIEQAEGPARRPVGEPRPRAGSARPVVTPPGGISRRAFLAGAGGLAAGAAGLAVGRATDDPGEGPAGDLAFIPFHGVHQAGITRPVRRRSARRPRSPSSRAIAPSWRRPSAG